MKKLCMLFILAFGFAFAFGFNAKAETAEVNSIPTENGAVVVIVDVANKLIDFQIEKAIDMEAKLTHDENYDQNLDQIINLLIAKTNAISDFTIYFAEKFGVNVVCYDQVVIIGDREVIIDPLFVFDW